MVSGKKKNAAPLPGFACCANKLKLRPWAYLEALASSSRRSPCSSSAAGRLSAKRAWWWAAHHHPMPTSAPSLSQRRRLRAGRFRCAVSPHAQLNAFVPGLGCRHADRCCANHPLNAACWMCPEAGTAGSVPASTECRHLNKMGDDASHSSISFRPGSERPWEFSAATSRLRPASEILAPTPTTGPPSFPRRQ